MLSQGNSEPSKLYQTHINLTHNQLEQLQVSAYLGSIEAEMDKMLELMDQDAKTLDLLEQSILERAFRGEL